MIWIGDKVTIPEDMSVSWDGVTWTDGPATEYWPEGGTRWKAKVTIPTGEDAVDVTATIGVDDYRFLATT